MNIEILKKTIIRYLSVLSYYVENLDSIHYFDINTTAEDFFKELLNIIYSAKYENINIVEMNACAIDLGDKENRIAIQVTSDKTSQKIKYTIKKFLEKKLYNQYDKLLILVITDKQESYTSVFDTKGKFNFSNKDIIDHKDISKEINKADEKKLEQILQYLESQFYIPYMQKNRTSSNEVETIMDLIEFISNNKLSEPLVIKDDYEPDPEFKIDNRFHQYAKNLKSTYGTLYTIYGEKIDNIEKIMQLDTIKIQLIKCFLKDMSVKFLIENNNNPIIALEELVQYFEDELRNSNKNYDRMAIKGYLINQVIKCNVFPNEV